VSLYETIFAVVAATSGDEYDPEGDRWLRQLNPDEAYLDVGDLTDALCDAVNAWLAVQR